MTKKNENVIELFCEQDVIEEELIHIVLII